MTAIAYPQRPHPFQRLLKVAILALLGTITGLILLGSHATNRHGNEAVRIRQCLEQQGPIQEWQDNERDDIRILVCELEPEPCPRWGVMIAQIWPSLITGCDMRERSSYVPRDGSPERVTEYLEEFAEVMK